MYKAIITLILFTPALYSVAQLDSDSIVINEHIDFLFDAMKANDSTGLAKIFSPDAVLKTVMTDKQENTTLHSVTITELLESIGTPRDDVYHEVLFDRKTLIDGPMAYTWTEYSFYINKKSGHCGVNMFQLIKNKGQWLITQITDTRRRSECQTYAPYQIDQLLDEWHRAAAVADEDTFFGMMTDNGIYIGTDAGERWTRDEMRQLLLPYFQRESAWSFTPTDRHIEFNDDNTIVWFDELLDTWMGPCRGSGVLIRQNDQWKISHYHLSIAVPNEHVQDYLQLIGKNKE